MAGFNIPAALLNAEDFKKLGPIRRRVT